MLPQCLVHARYITPFVVTLVAGVIYLWSPHVEMAWGVLLFSSGMHLENLFWEWATRRSNANAAADEATQ
jgi:hypothetical protein